ncbi:hypothetical protein DQ04_04241020 [Trypanosoma grayi]|uniref:hypothetical protein n=1 Tax=Trypanosoma grayi TaxID=71804 RepID=UPI0004F3F173|nr:hypothetical protein DQ04_04241020 [Trypanosoma grayi]KEG10056.1 hypothetical protein DQ04_04241020 [Trypanosoma grayi]
MAELERLRERNAKLREENTQLKKKLAEERPNITGDGFDDGHRRVEVESYRRLINEQDPQATILSLHDELMRLGRQCAVYADALEEARENFVEMKRLYSELNQILATCSNSNLE